MLSQCNFTHSPDFELTNYYDFTKKKKTTLIVVKYLQGEKWTKKTQSERWSKTWNWKLIKTCFQLRQKKRKKKKLIKSIKSQLNAALIQRECNQIWTQKSSLHFRGLNSKKKRKKTKQKVIKQSEENSFGRFFFFDY